MVTINIIPPSSLHINSSDDDAGDAGTNDHAGSLANLIILQGYCRSLIS